MTFQDARQTAPMLVIAHRGASVDAPENSVEAFLLADEQGADGVELDVRIDPTGELLVRHDPLPARGAETIVATPTLSAALDACGDEMLVNVEIKNLASDGGFDASMSIAHLTIDELRRRGSTATGRWLISSFSWATITACRSVAGDIATAYLCMLLDERQIERVAAAGHAAIHPWERSVTPALVERCHAAGLIVNVWTSNDPARLAELAALGVDGVCTDVPARARMALGRGAVTSADRPRSW
jgi:glycerophosphoryl diester phosphodiesterase